MQDDSNNAHFSNFINDRLQNTNSIDSNNPPLTPNSIPTHPTDYSAFVLSTLSRMSLSSSTITSPSTSTTSTTATTSVTNPTSSIDQPLLRQCINLSSSYLITDGTTNPTSGLSTWRTGFTNLIDIVVALHRRDELELDTMNAAAKACAECWHVAGAWRPLLSARDGVKAVAIKLKALLDGNGRTYRGGSVYAPSRE